MREKGASWDGTSLKGDDNILRNKYFSNELLRLAQGVRKIVSGSNTILFLIESQVPQDRKSTYGRIVCDIKPQKVETHRTRLTEGGNLIDYPGEIATPSVYIT